MDDSALVGRLWTSFMSQYLRIAIFIQLEYGPQRTLRNDSAGNCSFPQVKVSEHWNQPSFVRDQDVYFLISLLLWYSCELVYGEGNWLASIRIQ